MDLHWHVALVRTGQELKGLLALRGDGVDATFFRWRERRVARGHDFTVDVPLCPGCLFVRFDATDPYLWYRVRDLAGASSFIGGEYPTPLRTDELAPFFAQCVDDSGLMRVEESTATNDPTYRVGDRVRLLGFEDHDGAVGTVSVAVRGGVRLRGLKLFNGMLDDKYFPDSKVVMVERAGEREGHRLWPPKFKLGHRRRHAPNRVTAR
jgi:Transcription termination factor nusG